MVWSNHCNNIRFENIKSSLFDLYHKKKTSPAAHFYHHNNISCRRTVVIDLEKDDVCKPTTCSHKKFNEFL
jgi:hypothetical protein